MENHTQRTIRGENSIGKDIKNRFARCNELIDHLRLLTDAEDKNLFSIRRDLAGSYNRSLILSEEIEVLEEAIERKKEENPIIVEFESKSNELLAAMREKKYSDIPEIRSYCDKHKELYNMQKKLLNPYLSKAKQSRLNFLQELRRIMKLQYQIYILITAIYTREVDEGNYNYFERPVLDQISDQLRQLKDMQAVSSEVLDRFSDSLGNMALTFLDDVEDEIKTVDNTIISPMDESINRLICTVNSKL